MSIIDRLLRRQPQPETLALPPATTNGLTRAEVDHMDAWANAITGLGTSRDNSACNVFAGRLAMPYQELSAVYEGSRLMARFIDLEPNTCLAKGFAVAELSGDDVTALEDELIELDAFSSVANGIRWARLYGGAIVYMQVNDGRNPIEPVNEAAIVSVSSLTVFDWQELSVANWNETIGSKNYGLPETYRVSTWGKMFEVHWTRVMRFDGINVTRERRRWFQGFGPSVVAQAWDAFKQYGSTHAYLTGATAKINQGILKLKGLNDALKGSMAAKIGNRLRSLLASLSVIGDIVVDADSEDYVNVNRSMTGFKEAGELAEARLVGEWGVPKSILMGQSPGGLSNGDNAGDWKAWTQYCSGIQTNVLDKQVKRLVSYLFLARNSAVQDVPNRFTIVWPPLLQMSEEQTATIYATRAVGRASDIDSGVISAIEARRSDDVIETYHLDSESDVPEVGQPVDPGAGVQPPGPPELQVVGG